MSDAHQHQDPAAPAGPSFTMIPFVVDGWTLFDDTAGHHWILDLYLAEKAELANRHDIRVTIRKCIKDGSLQWDPTGDPLARAAASCEPKIIEGGPHDDETPGNIGLGGGESNETPGKYWRGRAHANAQPALVRALVASENVRPNPRPVGEVLIAGFGGEALKARWHIGDGLFEQIERTLQGGLS